MSTETTTEIREALVRSARLLATRPALAEAELRRLLRAEPAELNATLLLGRALRAQGKFKDAVAVLGSLAEIHPQFAPAHFELALAQSDAGAPAMAIASFREAMLIDPNLPNGWLGLADLLYREGDKSGADAAYFEHVRASAKAAHIREAADALRANAPEVAEKILRAHLRTLPTDVAALALLGETVAHIGDDVEAELLYARCLELVPSLTVARHNYGTILFRLHKYEETIIQVEKLLKSDPGNPERRSLLASAMSLCGRGDEAIQIFDGLVESAPDNPKIWVSYGNMLRTTPARDRALMAYRKSIELDPATGAAYWSIANFKTVPFSPHEIESMTRVLERDDLSSDDRVHLLFSLGKAFEDEGRFAESFAQYDAANTLKRADAIYNRDEIEARFARAQRFFTRDFLASRENLGCTAADPIFVVGMPRAGSTLIEQILASHPAIEGTMELSDLPAIVQDLREKADRNGVCHYPEILSNFSAAELGALGEDYLARTRKQRKQQRPFFTDKMPGNFAHVALIHLILPNARIIDARRHPLACGFSNFRQLYAQGQNFSYGLSDIGHYYRSYVELMAHFDRVLPGRVLRVHHEHMVENPEREIRRILDYCRVPFEPVCLNFHETEREVRTVSSDQVRQPIFRSGVDHWRNFESWLGPLKDALGSLLEAYLDVPEFQSNRSK